MAMIGIARFPAMPSSTSLRTTIIVNYTLAGRSSCIDLSNNLTSEGLAYSSNRECIVNPMHITASVCINYDESGLHHDYDEWLDDKSDRTTRAGEPVPA